MSEYGTLIRLARAVNRASMRVPTIKSYWVCREVWSDLRAELNHHRLLVGFPVIEQWRHDGCIGLLVAGIPVFAR